MSVLDEYIASEFVQKRIEQAGEQHFVCQDAEENILRRMMKDQNVADDVSISLSGTDFANQDYGRIFNAIQSVIKQGRHVDSITVEDSIGRLFPKNAKRLRELLVVLCKYKEFTVDDNQGIADHVKIVKELSVRRNAIKNLEGLVKQMYDPTKPIGDTLGAMHDALDNTGVESAEWVSISDVLMRTFEYTERLQRGDIKSITTGISSVDRIIGGFYGGELTVIGARPSVGKSAFGANIALAAAQKGHKVGIVSCEMVDIGFGQRLLAHGAWVDGMALRKGDLDDMAWAKMTDAMSEMGELPIEFMFESTYIEDVAQSVTRKVRHGNMDMLIVDYLQLMDTHKKFDSEHLRVGYISRTLKKLATQLNIPVIALAQVNRETDGVMPTLKSLKDSGSIEQDCDGVIFLHRPSSENDDYVDPRDKAYFRGFAERGQVYLAIGVAKQRQGAIGKTNVIFEPSMMRYTEINREG